MDRLVDLVAHGGVDGEEGRHLVGLLSGHDAEQRTALRFVGPDIDDRLHGPMALVHGTRPGNDEGHVQAIEAGGAEMTPVDPDEADRTA